MGYMSEYVNKRLSANDLEKELMQLISAYNKLQDTYLIVYVTSTQKQIPEAQLVHDDYYMIADMLTNKKGSPNLDVYIETPGGSGETAEEIVRFIHSNFTHINFVVSGEAKSAGTIMVLSGHEISMTDIGSLGPIDAQIPIGRSRSSAYDYMEWVNETQGKAQNSGSLDTFEAIMVAQITPGELNGVNNSLNFAIDLVKKWLEDYKFANWNETEDRKIPVTPEMKKNRAKEIAEILCNHSRWRSHGRSIKISDLNDIKLIINRIDDDPKLADIVYRIQTVCRLIMDSTTVYKIFATEDEKLFKNATPANGIPLLPMGAEIDVVEIAQTCPQCGKNHNIFCKLKKGVAMKPDHIAKGFVYYPNNDKIKCSCGFEIDLSGVRNQLEMQFGKKVFK